MQGNAKCLTSKLKPFEAKAEVTSHNARTGKKKKKKSVKLLHVSVFGGRLLVPACCPACI